MGCLQLIDGTEKEALIKQTRLANEGLADDVETGRKRDAQPSWDARTDLSFRKRDDLIGLQGANLAKLAWRWGA